MRGINIFRNFERSKSFLPTLQRTGHCCECFFLTCWYRSTLSFLRSIGLLKAVSLTAASVFPVHHASQRTQRCHWSSVSYSVSWMCSACSFMTIRRQWSSWLQYQHLTCGHIGWIHGHINQRKPMRLKQNARILLSQTAMAAYTHISLTDPGLTDPILFQLIQV